MMDLILRSVDEDIFFPAVAMHVNEGQHGVFLAPQVGIFLLAVFHQLLDSHHDRVKFHIRLQVLSIEVVASHRSPVVPHNDSIWVDHRDNLEHYPLSQLNCLFLLAGDELEEPLHHVGSVRFARVDPPSNDDSPLEAILWKVFRSKLSVKDCMIIGAVYSAGDRE
eukprot:CAMPEP_0170567778 /NCGR_PEP_ID=MMETSP0211-20121228/80700_1 /TAXON_ID=311385 /ORGANISM="Pseudokeronopsis sp., Strain OXSARD2" /LENGTH=164 /DNA_ID=CAMNT_0010889341 /DNA_START=2324 /DNA_END=2818 /DNA_ORIENTATION=-